ncbi:DUF1572 family protein [Dyadobacter frigoris]|uniref:DUF1572 domain-containing protein n=1 Tax=Dyadobacter frigoris TaxID=2576211 RepID=A0A4U6CUL2_9BACT|nr:DUF1572 family protein [Dyadobacter frigoris]TKT87415.1 DUF1572 domain-containing protein [Dyadobacter frigoris]GLU52338.1 hypothetical protein Dfri01_17990 [Dyadobacter frigoris]
MNKADYIFLYQRDLKKLRAEIFAYHEEDLLWIKLPGTLNSGGNLSQHLIGNLRTYIGLTLGHFPYVRDREAEFSSRLFSKSQLLEELDFLLEIIPESLMKLTESRFSEEYPHDILSISESQSVGLVLTHLSMHLAYHTGQINYHRRITHEKFDGNN